MNTKLPLMPKATAVWLVDNTALTFKQIAEFCGLHELEVKGIADRDIHSGLKGIDPVASGTLTAEEIELSTKDPNRKLQLRESIDFERAIKTKKGAKYTPIARRQDKPDAIYWIMKNYPEIPDKVIEKLIGTTKSTIAAIRNRTHWNIANIHQRDPVLLGLCSQVELDKIIEKTKQDTKNTPDEQA